MSAQTLHKRTGLAGPYGPVDADRDEGSACPSDPGGAHGAAILAGFGRSFCSSQVLMASLTGKGDDVAERDPDIERLDREHARTRAEVKQLWETVGSTREEMAAVKSSVDGITHEMRDFRTEMRNSVGDLSTASKRLTESVLHTEGSRSGAHSTVKIVLTTIGLTLTVAIVAIGVIRAAMM